MILYIQFDSTDNQLRTYIKYFKVRLATLSPYPSCAGAIIMCSIQYSDAVAVHKLLNHMHVGVSCIELI